MQNYYQNIAKTFDQDPFGLYKTTRELALQQLRQFISGQKKITTLLDLNVGTGNSFLLSQQYFSIQTYIGNDISSSMLAIAQERFPGFIAICDDALNIRQHVSDHSIDMMYVHYLLSYVCSKEIFSIAQKILKPGGTISILTTTKNSLREIQDYLSKYAPLLFNRKNFLKKYITPQSCEELADLAENYGFEILHTELYQQKIHFNNFSEVWNFGVEAGWLVQYFSVTKYWWLDKSLFRIISYLCEKFSRHLRYPVSGTMEFCMMTLRLETVNDLLS